LLSPYGEIGANGDFSVRGKLEGSPNTAAEEVAIKNFMFFFTQKSNRFFVPSTFTLLL